MRCARAQAWMTAAADGELAPRRRRALDGHVAGCPTCREEQKATERVLTALGTLSTEAAVSGRLEQATLRAVRLARAAEEEGAAARRWWESLRLPAVALAGAAVVVLAFGVLRSVERRGGGRDAGAPRLAQGPVREAAPAAPAPPTRVARRPEAVTPPPRDPPAELADAPELFVDLPIFRNMDKLRNYEAIQTTTLEDVPAPGLGERSSG